MHVKPGGNKKEVIVAPKGGCPRGDFLELSAGGEGGRRIRLSGHDVDIFSLRRRKGEIGGLIQRRLRIEK